MVDETAATPEGDEQARRDGYRKGLNVGLLTVAIPCGLLAALRSFSETPRYEEVFKQVKVPMPGLTLLVVQIYPQVATALIIGALGCGLATRLWGHRQKTILLNGGYLLLALLWLTVLTTALHLPMMSLFDGIGGRRG
jgi:hypothetical protein